MGIWSDFTVGENVPTTTTGIFNGDDNSIRICYILHGNGYTIALLDEEAEKCNGI